MRIVLLDTVGLLALWDESDQWNEDASKAYERLRQRPVRLVTTTWILTECGNAASRRPFRKEVPKLRALFERAGNLLHPTDSQVHSAWEEYAKREPGAAGIVDIISFLLMKEHGIVEAFTNDAHFRAEGFTTLF